MAVLYRSHFHALELQFELTRRNIPFSITSGIRFFEQAHVKDVAAYLKLVHNPRDEISFKRLVRMMPGVGGKSADKLWNVFRAACSVSELDSEHATRNTQHADAPLAVTLQKCSSSVPKKTAAAWKEAGCQMKQVPLNEIKDDLSNFLRLAEKEDIVITRHGKPAGYIVGFADEDDWIDYMMLRDPRFRERLQQSLQDVKEGRVVTLEELRTRDGRANGKAKVADVPAKKQNGLNGHKKRAAKVLQAA